MATKATNNAPKKDGWEPKGFANLYLTEQQMQHAFQTYEKWEKTEHDWQSEMANGYRFTFSYDARSDAIVCTCNCKDQASPNAGWLLSSFAPTWQESLVLTLYKSIVVLDHQWGDSEQQAPSRRYG